MLTNVRSIAKSIESKIPIIKGLNKLLTCIPQIESQITANLFFREIKYFFID